MTHSFPEKRLAMTLSDRLNQDEGWFYMTGMQALVSLPIRQARRDKSSGLNTGGYISGYRGSPIGRYDMELWNACAQLRAHNIVFQAGLNEDLAATAVWGSQLVGHFPGAKVDGVFSIWYGKAPGMDRSMDALRHANLAGTNPRGGSLVLVGDDHGAKSSTLACYSDLNFPSIGVPLLAPSNVQEVIDFGLHGIAMSRCAGTLVGMKLVTDVIEGGGSVYIDPKSPKILVPEAQEDVAIRPHRDFLAAEQLLWDVKVERATQYARLNNLNKVHKSDKARIGIVSSGKSWQDLQQALVTLGFDGGEIPKIPLRLLKVGMIWPLDPTVIGEFAQGLEMILVVEEKRGLLEDQIRTILYETAQSPRIVGKFFSRDAREIAFPNFGEFGPDLVGRVVNRLINETYSRAVLPEPKQPAPLSDLGQEVRRPPAFCAGCPHGRSTQVPSHSRALAGIGCHSMAALRHPAQTNSMSHMGGEGAMWLGQFPFTDEPHVFANMGDGTYNHSGLMAIRGAVAARAPMTYKLLHNGFVSMTGGQPHEGHVSPQSMVRQLRAEGIKRIAVVSDEPKKFKDMVTRDGITLHHRTEMDAVQAELRGIREVTALIYDQPCATERRRLRKRGKWADPAQRVYINPEVCEGCGECSTVSQCMAIEPLETPLGRKRKINQSSCNKDLSCLEGFCPSLVTVQNAKPRTSKPRALSIDTFEIPEPSIPALGSSWAIVISGIGGTGVVTIGQMLAVAAHADGYFSSSLDITGLAQKYGAVHSHVKMAPDPKNLHATRIATGEAKAMIGCDLAVAAGNESLSKICASDTLCVTDTTPVPTGEFSMNPDWTLNADEQLERLTRPLGHRAVGVQAQEMAERVLGDRVYANMLLVGASWQQGGIPLSYEALMRGIELNGVAIEQNKQAFALGRLVIADPAAAANLVGNPTQAANTLADEIFEDLVRDRLVRLNDYGGPKFASRYSRAMAQVRRSKLTEPAKLAAARGYFKLLAVKDEWEVARLYARPEFMEQVKREFEGKVKLSFHLGAWPFARRDKATGHVRKIEIGQWLFPAFRIMAGLRWLRGSFLDPFKNNKEAKLHRELLRNFEADLALACAFAEAKPKEVETLLALPERIRGFGHIREQQAANTSAHRRVLRNTISYQRS